MPDKSIWEVPVASIIYNRVGWYADNKGMTEEEALQDTEELFQDDYEIEDWAANNMDWEEVKHIAVKVEEGSIDYDDGWVNGEKEVVDR
jgi:hypothetical protein